MKKNKKQKKKEKKKQERKEKKKEQKKPGIKNQDLKKRNNLHIQKTAGKTKNKVSDHHPHEKKDEDIKESYQLSIDKAKVNIKIERGEKGFEYKVSIPKIDVGTEALLDEIRKELISVTTIAVGEITDQKSVTEIKDRFMEDARRILKEKIPSIKEETQDFLIGILMQDMLGLGKIEFLISDPELEEIVIINSKEPVRVYHKKYRWLPTNIFLKTEEEINNYANIIARRVGRQITVLTPLLDAHVVTGDRANAVLYPISTKGNTITIRKFARDPWTIIDLIQNNTVSPDIAALLWLAIEYEMNVLISGGTASGKTAFLNSCMPFIPPNHRVISMEDTRELMLPEFLYWCPLVTRSANAEGKGEVSMLDLLVNSLRMRPDRVILGEIRRQKEAEVLFEAMHTGHSVYSTVHADTANETIRRLTNPPINIPPSMLNNVNLNVIMFRDRRRGVRRVFQLAEFLTGKEGVTANILYRWIPETDTFAQHNNSLVFFDELSRHTGMSQQEITKDLEHKKQIFSWLIKNKIRNLESIGKVMNLYYMYPEKLEIIMKNNETGKIIKQAEDNTKNEI
jgi:flagellar protein FlaI